MKYNEEFIKNNVLMPFLVDSGFNEYELEFENTFNIQLGRGIYNVKNEEVSEASGRLDILCKIDGRNLFIIEMKAEGVEITDKDRKQALSYARLIEPMAAYAIVSNAKVNYLYDTITGKRVDKTNENIVNGDFELELDEELSSLRFEGLKYFIGYSFSNLIAFCKLNNEVILDKFCSKNSYEFNKKTEFKYIPELYVKRECVEEKFVEFIEQSEKKVFAVIGESGAGKTNILCHISQELLGEPFLFFSGSIMGKSLLDEIINDFNIIFSSEESKISLLKKISIILGLHKKEITIIIDAIDEWEAEDKVSQLNQLVKYISNLNIKICISCKTLMWIDFKIKNGVDTYIKDNIFFETPILEGFSEKEFDEAIDKYCSFFQTNIENKTHLHNMENPFSLRVASEVANLDNQPLDNCFDSIETIKKYISLKLDKFNNKNLANRFLKIIAECTLDQNKILVREDDIRSYSQLSITEEIPEELFAFNFLYKYVDESGNVNIGFYFSGIRDYLIAIVILSLNKLNSYEKQEKIMSVLSSYIGENAVIYFFKIGREIDKEDCLKAIIEYDKKYTKDILIKLLSLKEIIVYDNIEKTLKHNILQYLIQRFINTKDNYIISEKIISIMKKLGNVENELIEMFSILLKFPESNFTIVSHQISDALQSYDSIDGTLKLVKMCLNSKNDGYIRRYIVESLKYRKIDNKIEIFLKLIIDPDPNVRSWAQEWYCELEDLNLRNMLFDMIGTISNGGILKHVFTTLGLSKIADTGEKLFSILLNNKYDKITTAWLCRSLTDLKFKEAIQTFIIMFEENHNNELAEHLAICFDELDVKESSLILLNKIKKDLDLGKSNIFIDRAFAHVASDEDIKLLMDYSMNEPNKEKISHKYYILTEIPHKDYSSLIFDVIMDSTYDIITRERLLSNWAQTMEYNNMADVNKGKVLKHLYDLFIQNSEISIIAFNVIISIEDDMENFYKNFIKVLPKLSYSIDFRLGFMPKLNKVEKFGKVVIEWVNKELMINIKEDKVYIANLLRFCAICGNQKSIEIIHNIREQLYNIISEEYISFVEHCITGDVCITDKVR